MAYPDFFDENQQLIEAALDRLMPSAETMPPTIHQAMRYSARPLTAFGRCSGRAEST